MLGIVIRVNSPRVISKNGFIALCDDKLFRKFTLSDVKITERVSVLHYNKLLLEDHEFTFQTRYNLNMPERSSSRVQIWLLAIRPKTLFAAAAPVIVGSAMAYTDGGFHAGPALVCLLTALLLQIGSNLANDVFDYERGADQGERFGPIRVTQSELLAPWEVKRGMLVVFGLSILLGLYLTFVGRWPILILGMIAIISAIAYTGGPFPLGYHGLGDLFVFIFFGLAAVMGTYYIQVLAISATVWWMAVAMGLLTVAILVVNNLRDKYDVKINDAAFASLDRPQEPGTEEEQSEETVREEESEI